MKKVLVTGAAGAIGSLVIKYLLSEGKYDVTAIDLKNRNSLNVFRKYRKRINIVYGDVTDPILMDALVKENDYIIHLAGVMPPLASLKDSLNELIDYKGTENIVRSIEFYNNKCYLIYPSSTCIYDEKNDEVKVSSKLANDSSDYYGASKIKIEKLITSRLKNYVIFRLPLVLSNLNENSYIYTGNGNRTMELVTDNDVSYALVNSISNIKKLNGKKFNLAGGEGCTISYNELLLKIFKYYGISHKYITTRVFAPKMLKGFVYQDSDELDDILHFRNDSIDSFMMRNARISKRRKLNIILAKPFAFFIKKGNK